MHESLSLLLVYIVFLGAMMSPGPDFLLVLRNVLGHSARAGVFTATGIVAGNIVHMVYCLAGIGLLISQSIILFNLIKWVGAAYLVYIGVCALRSRGVDLKDGDFVRAASGITDRKAFVSGFVTNLFNPKATMFFLALFSQMIDPDMPMLTQLAFCALCLMTVFAWFSGVSAVMGVSPVRRAYAKASKWIDRVFGAFFMALGIRLAMVRAG